MKNLDAGAQRQTVLDDFNVVCCFFVVLAHTLSLGITQADRHSGLMAVIYFPWLIARFSVPGFLFVGGVKVGLALFGNTVPPYFSYMKRRIQKVFLPYLLWTVVYYVCYTPIGYVRGRPSELLYYLWSGTLSAQFYYVFVAMQFYLLRPLWAWLLKRVPAVYGLLASCVIMLAAGALLDRATLYAPFFTPLMNRTFLRYLFYWISGLYAGRYYEHLMVLLRKKALKLVCPVILLVYYLLSYLEFRLEAEWTVLAVYKPFSNLAAILFLLSLCLSHVEIRSVWDFLHQSSLTVFFSHCLVLTLSTVALNRFGVTRLALLLPARLLLACSLPILLYWAGRRLRLKKITRS